MTSQTKLLTYMVLLRALPTLAIFVMVSQGFGLALLLLMRMFAKHAGVYTSSAYVVAILAILLAALLGTIASIQFNRWLNRRSKRAMCESEKRFMALPLIHRSIRSIAHCVAAFLVSLISLSVLLTAGVLGYLTYQCTDNAIASTFVLCIFFGPAITLYGTFPVSACVSVMAIVIYPSFSKRRVLIGFCAVITGALLAFCIGLLIAFGGNTERHTCAMSKWTFTAPAQSIESMAATQSKRRRFVHDEG
jgi:hypothetical protein